jgi:hypothetical protein
MWPESREALASVSKQAETICSSLYARIVDRGVGHMWGFCKSWAWDQLEAFLKDEGYTATPDTPNAISQSLKQRIGNQRWYVNPQGRLGCLYLLGKSKSLVKHEWLWRGISADPAPFLTKRQLRATARSMTRFLRYLSHEIPCNILLHSVRDLARWY